MTAPEEKTVREFRHMLLWPLQLRRLGRGCGFTHPWEALRAQPGPWKEVKDNLLVDDDSCTLGYREFVYFLPYVQRFLYGFGESDSQTPSSLQVFKRDDIAKVHVRLSEASMPLEFDVARLRLIFFYDVDIALLALEIVARDLPLAMAVETMDRFGRPYPPSWESPRQAAHCTYQVEFLDAQGRLQTASDYGDRDKYLSLVRDIKQTPLSLHWENLLKPLVPAYLGGCVLQYYQIENKRIPMMSFLSFDEPRVLSRGDLARIAFATKWGESDTLPYSPRFLADFEDRYCYDRFWDAEQPDSGMNTRYMFCGPAFAMITKHGDACRDLVQNFRHQFFQIGVITNFHKASLLNLSNRFSIAVERLRVGDYDSVRLFKQNVRETLELFLRFNHRYWFHDLEPGARRRSLQELVAPARERRALRGGEGGGTRHQRIPRRGPHAALLGQRAAPHRGVGMRHGRHGGHRLPRHEPVRALRLHDVREDRDLPAGLHSHDRAHRLHRPHLAAPRDLHGSAGERAHDLDGEGRRLPPDLERAQARAPAARRRRRRAVEAGHGTGNHPTGPLRRLKSRVRYDFSAGQKSRT